MFAVEEIHIEALKVFPLCEEFWLSFAEVHDSPMDLLREVGVNSVDTKGLC